MMMVLALVLSQASFIVQQGRARDGGVSWPVNLTSSGSSFSQPVTQDEYNKSSFGAVRTAAPYTLADNTNVSSFDTLDTYGTSTTGAGSVLYLTNESSVLLSAPTGSTAKLRTNDQYRYQAGKGQRVLMTGSIPTALDAGTYSWGLFDDNDGLFWRADSTGLKFIVRSSTDGGVNETAYVLDAGSAWVPSNEQIWEMRFQWLGVGKVDTYLNGNPLFSHEHANTLPSPYIKTAFLPLSWEVSAAGSATAQQKYTCSTVMAEGGGTPTGYSYSVSAPTDVTVNNGTTDLPIISMRPAATFASKVSRSQIMPWHVWCVSDSKRIRVKLILNPSALTGAVFAAAGTGSSAESDYTASAVTGGQIIASFAVQSGGFYDHDVHDAFAEVRRHMRRKAYSTPSTTGLEAGLDTLVVAVSNPGAGNTSVNCGIEFTEIR